DIRTADEGDAHAFRIFGEHCGIAILGQAWQDQAEQFRHTTLMRCGDRKRNFYAELGELVDACRFVEAVGLVDDEEERTSGLAQPGQNGLVEYGRSFAAI